jgi:cyclase
LQAARQGLEICKYIFIAALALPGICGAQEEIYPGYAWHSLGNGIYVHSQNDPLAGPVDGNSVVIVSDDGVFVVDTHINPAVARSVIRKIRAITDSPVTHVVNTHWHDDHTNGNHAYREAFPDVKIIAHRATLRSLRKEWQAMEDQRRETYEPIDVVELRQAATLLEEDDPDKAIGYRVYAGYVEALRPELPGLQLEYPDTVLEESLVYEFDDRTIHINWLGPANTDGDVVVWLPDERVLATGDMLVAPIPYAFDSPMLEWINTLIQIEALDVATIIPGHGPVQHNKRYLARVKSLLEATVNAVRQAYDDGVSYADLAQAVDLSAREREFTNDDPEHAWAWRAYFVTPGIASAWSSLGFAVPDE